MSDNKNCRICKIYKEQLAFKKSKNYKSGYSTICKDCHNLQNRIYSKTEKGKLNKKLYLNSEKGKIVRKNTCATYYQTKVKNRLKNDKKFKIAYNLRVSIAHIIKQKNFYKKSKLKDILGCNLEFLKTYLEETFKKNYNREVSSDDYVEIDHIVPISSAKTVEELYGLNHFSNLQLLLRHDNRRKSDNLEFSINVTE